MEQNCENCAWTAKSPTELPCSCCKLGMLETDPGYEHMASLWMPQIQPVTDDDAVNHPSYYTSGKIEVADFIADQRLNFDRGNAVKYICRAGKKDPAAEVQDLKKAAWYIQHEIRMIEEGQACGEETP